MLTITNKNGLSASIGPNSAYSQIEDFALFIWEEADEADYRAWADMKNVMREVGGKITGNEGSEGTPAKDRWTWWMLPGGAKVKVLGGGQGISQPKRAYGKSPRK